HRSPQPRKQRREEIVKGGKVHTTRSKAKLDWAATIEKDETGCGIKDQGRSGKIVEYKVPRSGRIPTMGEKHSARGKERWYNQIKMAPKDNEKTMFITT
ncbi:hypothetical protein CR513_54893, partial [Mucuna pruriens]